MVKSGGLGRGLDALMADIETSRTSTAVSAELMLDPAILKPNPFQPRTDFDETALRELADSIREHGIIQPVIAEELPDGSYHIIAGERRTRAARIAGLTRIPVILRKFSDERKLEIALIENIQRENLNPVEEAQAYLRLMNISNLSQEEIAARVGKNRSTVANSLRLLKLPEDMLSSLSTGQITSGHARALLSVINPADQRILFGRIVGNTLSVREAEQMAGELNGGSRASHAKDKSPTHRNILKNIEVQNMEQRFIDILGTKVTVKGNLEKGTIEIAYFSRDDLERLFTILTS